MHFIMRAADCVQLNECCVVHTNVGFPSSNSLIVPTTAVPSMFHSILINHFESFTFFSPYYSYWEKL